MLYFEPRTLQSYLIEEHHNVVVGLVEVGEEGHVDLLDVAGDHEDVLVHQPPTDLLLVLERSLVEQEQPISVWKVVVELDYTTEIDFIILLKLFEKWYSSEYSKENCQNIMPNQLAKFEFPVSNPDGSTCRCRGREASRSRGR